MLRPPHTQYDRLVVYHLDRQVDIAVDDGDLIGLWQEDGASVLFFHRERDRLVEDLGRRHGFSVSYRAELAYRDWEAGVDVVPFHTRLLTVLPVWWTAGDSAAQRSGDIGGPSPDCAALSATILLDPGVVFGSGFHATTRLCLETLEDYVAGPAGRAASVLDLGTGTGLLAVAAASLGAVRVTGVEYNPLACEVARANCRRNAAAACVEIVQADLGRDPGDTAYDLVVVNLFKGLLEKLFGDPRFWRGRRYIVSGFLSSMEPDLLAALPTRNLRVLERRSRDNWRLWVLENAVAVREAR